MSFFFITGLFIIFIVLVGVLIYLCRNCRLYESCKRRITAIKKAIFYNSIIRYSLLNALKLNLTAMLGLRASGSQ